MSGLSGDVIRSSDNPTVKYIRSLRQRDTRESERAFVVEGARAIADGIAAGGNVRLVLIREGARVRNVGVDPTLMRTVDARLFSALADTVTPQPLLAVFDIPEVTEQPRRVPLLLIADGIQDPGNFGTLLRSAAGAGATAVVVTPGTVDPYNPKVVRAGMGVHFRIPIQSLDDRRRERLLAECQHRVVAEAGAQTTYDAIDWRAPAAIIIGSEAHGPSELGRAIASCSASIPLQLGVESLNAGVAGSIFLFEAARQRRGN